MFLLAALLAALGEKQKSQWDRNLLQFLFDRKLKFFSSSLLQLFILSLSFFAVCCFLSLLLLPTCKVNNDDGWLTVLMEFRFRN